jgi:zinc protease
VTMLRVFALATFALAATLAGQPASARKPAQAQSIIPFPVQQKTLANGLQVVVIPMKGTGLIGYRTTIRTGARDEYEVGRTGFAHFFEHMMFRGTDKYPEAVYEELLTKMGADTNAYTSQDVTVYMLNVAAEDLETVMELESDRFKNLKYAKQQFQTEAGAVYGEYRKNRTSPFFAVYEALLTTAFDKHTYGHTVIGYEKDIAAMPEMFDYSRRFFQRYYRPDNAILVIAGDVEPERVFALAEKYYGDWQKGYVAPKIKPEPAQREERRKDVAYDGRALPMISIGYKGGAYDPNDRVYMASLVLAELAFGESSELYRRLVLDEQSVQSISAEPAMSRDPNLFTIDATVKDPAKIDATLAAIDATVAHYRENLADPEAVAAVKSHVRYSFIMDLDSPARVAGRVAHMAGVMGSVDALDAGYRTLAGVTPEDVRAAAQKYLASERRTVIVLRGKE